MFNNVFKDVQSGKLPCPLGYYAQMTDVVGLCGFEKAMQCIKYTVGRENTIVKTLTKNRMHPESWKDSYCDDTFARIFIKLIDHDGFYRTKDGHMFWMTCPYQNRESASNELAALNEFCKLNHLKMITADAFYNPGNTMIIIASAEDIRFIDKIEVALISNGSICETW